MTDTGWMVKYRHRLYIDWRRPTRPEWVGPRPSKKIDWSLVKDNLRAMGAFITAIGVYRLIAGEL